MKPVKNHTAGPELHDAVKAGFVLQGTSLAVWSRKNGVNPQSTRNALLGSWTGPSAKRWIANMIKASKAAQLLAIKKDGTND